MGLKDDPARLFDRGWSSNGFAATTVGRMGLFNKSLMLRSLINGRVGGDGTGTGTTIGGGSDFLIGIKGGGDFFGIGTRFCIVSFSGSVSFSGGAAVDSSLVLRSLITLMSNDDSVLKHLCRASVLCTEKSISGETVPSIALDDSHGFSAFDGIVSVFFGVLSLHFFSSLGTGLM